MTIKKPAAKKAETESSTEYLVDRVINAGSPPPPPTEVAPIIEEKEIKFQMVISPELCRSIDGARKLSRTSRRAWLLQAAQEKLEREGKML
jgi:hypothetical protein